MGVVATVVGTVGGAACGGVVGYESGAFIGGAIDETLLSNASRAGRQTVGNGEVIGAMVGGVTGVAFGAMAGKGVTDVVFNEKDNQFLYP